MDNINKENITNNIKDINFIDAQIEFFKTNIRKFQKLNNKQYRENQHIVINDIKTMLMLMSYKKKLSISQDNFDNELILHSILIK